MPATTVRIWNVIALIIYRFLNCKWVGAIFFFFFGFSDCEYIDIAVHDFLSWKPWLLLIVDGYTTSAYFEHMMQHRDLAPLSSDFLG